MGECVREGCSRPAEVRPRHEGACSLQCRDTHEQDTEIARPEVKAMREAPASEEEG